MTVEDNDTKEAGRINITTISCPPMYFFHHLCFILDTYSSSCVFKFIFIKAQPSKCHLCSESTGFNNTFQENYCQYCKAVRSFAVSSITVIMYNL